MFPSYRRRKSFAVNRLTGFCAVGTSDVDDLNILVQRRKIFPNRVMFYYFFELNKVRNNKSIILSSVEKMLLCSFVKFLFGI